MRIVLSLISLRVIFWRYFFDRFLLASEKSKVEGYLAHKWRGTDSLVVRIHIRKSHQFLIIVPTACTRCSGL